MSTLKIATIQDLSSANSSTPEQIAQGRAKAWVNFNGTGTVAIRDSFNVSSITDTTTGTYVINLSTAMPSANIAIAGAAGNNDTIAASWIVRFGTSAPTVSTIPIGVHLAGTGAADAANISIAIFGD